jgi:hypothetical protein
MIDSIGSDIRMARVAKAAHTELEWLVVAPLATVRDNDARRAVRNPIGGHRVPCDGGSGDTHVGHGNFSE